ncbi:MAG: DUF4270 family protein [Alistipes sp.]|nr:DUF4270 family protein [Alistipes sp.]
MRVCSKLFRNITTLLLAVGATALFTGCTMTADSMLGANMMPEEQVMVMKHLKYRGNNIVRINTTTGSNETIPVSGKNFIETRQYRTDSILSSNLSVGYMGVRRSDIFGVRSAGFASSIIYMNDLDKDKGWGYLPIFDTMKMLLTINEWGGDTLTPVRFNIYELKGSLIGNVLKTEDSTAYINCDLSPIYDEDKPIFTFTFPAEGSTQGPATQIITLDPVAGSNNGLSDQTWDFVRRLMLIPDDYNAPGSDWDGYGRDSIEVYQNEDKWVKKFFGIYIKPDIDNIPAGKEGAMYSTSLDASGLMLQGRNRNPKDPTLIQDTVGMYYYFYDEYTTHNLSVNKIERDLSKSLSGGPALLNSVEMSPDKNTEERTMVSTCYVEGMGGAMIELTFTDDWLNEIISLETNGEEVYTKMGINQCLMSIYVAGASYDWNITQGNVVELVPLLDESMERLGAYLEYTTLTPIIDYDYVYENQYNSSLPYDGYLDRSRGCYVFNITAHMQRLVNYAKNVKQEDGSFLFDKEDKNYTPRSIFIGTEAYSLYDFATSKLQGMTEGADGAKVDTPIEFDLTYTLVK